MGSLDALQQAAAFLEVFDNLGTSGLQGQGLGL